MQLFQYFQVTLTEIIDMHKYIFILLLPLLTLSCGTGRQLSRAFDGKPESILEGRFGKPVSVIEQPEGKIYVFENKEELNSTEINQGKLALDPIITPRVHKTERYYFTVRDGIIVKSKFEEEYHR